MDADRPGEVTPAGVLFDTGGVQDQVVHEPCGQCGQSPVAVQTYMYVMSFLIFTQHETYQALLCRACSTRQGLKELGKSALLGWWGIPWGLMTFKALWVDTRTLIRWSTLGPVAAFVLGVAGLFPPAALGVWFYLAESAEEAAKATGDWGDDRTIGIINEGHRKSEEGDLDGALESYKAAYLHAPNSSVVNFSIATTLQSLGRNVEALPYAAKAESLKPNDTSYVGLHGVLLFSTNDEAGARSRAERLQDSDPEEPIDAKWMVALFDILGQFDEKLKAAEKGLVLDPDDHDLKIERIDALLRLDKLEEAKERLEDLDSAEQALPFARYLKVAHQMRVEAPAGMDGLLELWKDKGLNEALMERLVGPVRGTGDMAAMKSRVALWLHDTTTSADAWFLAHPWFDDEEWVAQLDRYLAGRREVIPVLLRIETMDPIEQHKMVLRLADSVRADDHPWAVMADNAYFDALVRDVPEGDYLSELGRHVADHSSHAQCRLRLCNHLINVDFESALPCIDEAEKLTQSAPAGASYVKILRIEQRIVQGEAEAALEELQRWPPNPDIAFYVAEAAFHAGRTHTLDKTLKEIGAMKDPTMEAAALLLRWSEEIVQGMVPTYDIDVELLMKQYGNDMKRSESASAQAILVAEGIVDRPWARKVIGDRSAETFDLVAGIKRLANEKKVSLSVFDGLASSPRRGAYGARLARSIIARGSLKQGT